LKQQSKVVHLTATATDTKNQTANAGADVTVTLKPEARRLDDIVFQPRSARVNNCGKRLLIDVVTPILRNDPDAKVVLIGHRDMNEGARSRVDEDRVLDAAAVLSAGTGICPSLDLSRVLVNWVGTDQASQTRPALCGSSTNVKERSGQAVRENDQRAQYRRVEIWVIPGGADMPANLTGLKPAPEKEIKAKGCPR
jgi:outer membrane protein OmpA-like peptidoglycan-associated protein